MRLVAFLTEPRSIGVILDHLGEPSAPQVSDPGRPNAAAGLSVAKS
jgi:hypothetical protein